MATLAELVANVAKIRKFVGIYLDVPELNEKQKNALKVDLIQLDKNLDALAAYKEPVPVVVTPAVPVPVAVQAPVVEVPNFGDSKAMSSGLYGDWVSEWFQRTFPDAYRDWPPTVYAVTPEAIVEAATKDGCLAQVSACGSLGFPGGPYDDIGDWSLYTQLISTATDDGRLVHKVFHMGRLVGAQEGGDGLEFAKSLGFNW